MQHLLLVFLGSIDSVDLSVVLNLLGIAGGLCGECSLFCAKFPISSFSPLYTDTHAYVRTHKLTHSHILSPLINWFDV